MTAFLIHLGQHVEEKWLHIKVESLVIEEEFGQEAKVLTVDLVIVAVDLKDGDGSLAIDLLPRRLVAQALTNMFNVRPLKLHVLEAVLTDPELWLFTVLLRVRGEVPGVDLVLSDLDLVDVLDLGEGFVLFLQCSRSGVHFVETLCTHKKKHVFTQPP